MRRAKILTIYGPEMKMCVTRKAGLAITRSAGGGRRWTLTHVKSGRRVGPLSDLPLAVARRALAIASEIGDWSSVDFGVVPQGVHDVAWIIHEMIWAD